MRFVVFVSLALLGGVSAAHAVEGIRYSQRNRFAVLNDDAQGDINVSITEEKTLSMLPPFIKGQLSNVLTNCLEDPSAISLVKVYKYESESARTKKMAPNYLFDFTGLRHKKLKNCSQPTVCQKNGHCALWGYKALDKNIWDRAVNMDIVSWSTKIEKVENANKMMRTKLVLVNANDKCVEQGGVLTKERYCSMEYAWRGASLSRSITSLPKDKIPTAPIKSNDKKSNLQPKKMY